MIRYDPPLSFITCFIAFLDVFSTFLTVTRVILWNATEEGAIAPKALVNVRNKCQIQPSLDWWIREEYSRVTRGIEYLPNGMDNGHGYDCIEVGLLLARLGEYIAKEKWKIKHCQRHNGPEGWVHFTSTNLDQISSSESWPSINFKISTKQQPIKLKLQNLDQTKL